MWVQLECRLLQMHECKSLRVRLRVSDASAIACEYCVYTNTVSANATAASASHVLL